MDKEQCPKCDGPAITNRRIRGEKNWICGNGHNWTSEQSKFKERAKSVERVTTPVVFPHTYRY